MSFSISVKVEPGQDVANAVDAAFGQNPTAADVAGPFAAVARDVAVASAAAVRRAQDGVAISISGHRNAGNEPVKGWASSAISVSVSQVYPPD